jgi:hypothetical protein
LITESQAVLVADKIVTMLYYNIIVIQNMLAPFPEEMLTIIS